MEDLIPITREGDRLLVSARDLHDFLDITTPFRKWMPRMFEYGFTNGIDYTPDIFVHPQNGQQIKDFSLMMDCAKEIAMIQRTDKGKEARQYFIEKEKELRAIRSLSPAELILEMSKQLVAKEKADQLRDERLDKLEAKTTTRVEAYSAAGYAKIYGRVITTKEAAAIGRLASRMCREQGVTIDTTYDPRFGTVNIYPVEVVGEAFDKFFNHK
jgi:phage anti-repressor protein